MIKIHPYDLYELIRDKEASEVFSDPDAPWGKVMVSGIEYQQDVKMSYQGNDPFFLRCIEREN